tara:strand:+ start:3277 stop:4038 length:762 start_codon:yes stop_codon:yes gene_type:complete
MKKINTLIKMIKTLKNPHSYLLGYLGLKKGFVLYKLRNGVKLKVRGGATDRFILNEVWLHKSYNPPGFSIREGDTVVDIGGHIGVFTVYAAHHARKGRVYAFEPVKANFNLLKENVKINKYKNVEIFNKAVGGAKGVLKFFVSQTRNKGHNSMYRLGKHQKEVKVDKISFSHFLKDKKQVDFLKMDCEGGEYDILLNLKKNEIKKIKKISMEYHNYEGRDGEEIVSFLRENGFKVRVIKEGKQFGTIYAINQK